MRDLLMKAHSILKVSVPIPQCRAEHWQVVQELERALAEPARECLNCASLEDQNTELDRKLSELTEAVLRANGIGGE